MNINKKYDPSPGGEEESFSDMLSPSRTSNLNNPSRNFNSSCPTVTEGFEPTYDGSIATEESALSVKALVPQDEQHADPKIINRKLPSCTSQEGTAETEAKVIINAPPSVENKPVNLKLVNRRPTGYIRLTDEELSRDSSLFTESNSNMCQESIVQLGAVTVKVPAKKNKPANLKIVHRRPTGIIRTPHETDSYSFKESIQQINGDDGDEESSNLNSIDEIPGNEHKEAQVKEQQEFSRENGDNRIEIKTANVDSDQYQQLTGTNVNSVESIENLVGKNEDVGSGTSAGSEESNETYSQKSEDSDQEGSETSTSHSIDDNSDEFSFSNESAGDEKVVTLKVPPIKDKPVNMKNKKCHPTGFLGKSYHEYDIERRKKLKGPARFAFQYESFIIRDYWKKSKPAIKSIPVGGPPPPLPKRPKRK